MSEHVVMIPPVPREAVNLLYLISGLPLVLTGIGIAVSELFWKNPHSLHPGALFFIAAAGTSVIALILALIFCWAQKRNHLSARGIIFALALNIIFLGGAGLLFVVMFMAPST